MACTNFHIFITNIYFKEQYLFSLPSLGTYALLVLHIDRGFLYKEKTLQPHLKNFIGVFDWKSMFVGLWLLFVMVKVYLS